MNAMPAISVPDVSVVMPVWNAAATVADAIASVRAQTTRSWELIAVDDGSTDDSAAVMTRAAGDDPRIRIVREPHRGIVAALNSGLARVRAPLIARMDADDRMMPTRLEVQRAFLDARPDVGVAGCLVDFGGDRKAARGYAIHVDWINTLRTSDEIARARFIESPLAHPSVMFRRELIVMHGGYTDSGEPEDYELWLRWMDAGVRFGKVTETLLQWNDPPGRLSRAHPRYSAAAFYACKCRYLARFLHSGIVRDRALILWGAGRITRKRLAPLETAGVRFSAYVDIDPRKIGTRLREIPVLAPQDIPPPASCFVLGAVGARGAREAQRAHLLGRGFREGEDFVFAA